MRIGVMFSEVAQRGPSLRPVDSLTRSAKYAHVVVDAMRPRCVLFGGGKTFLLHVLGHARLMGTSASGANRGAFAKTKAHVRKVPSTDRLALLRAPRRREEQACGRSMPDVPRRVGEGSVHASSKTLSLL